MHNKAQPYNFICSYKH